MDMGLEGKVALVTGGTSGIGKATVLALVDQGMKVAFCGRDQARLDAALKAVEEQGGVGLSLRADISVEKEASELASRVVESYGRLDILVNNAGRAAPSTLSSLTPAQIRKTVDTKIVGYLVISREAAHFMRKQGGGRIINMIGGTGKEPLPGVLGGSTTNAALLGLSKGLSQALVKDNILVNTICLGQIDTPMQDWMTEQLAQDRGISIDEMRRARESQIPLGRFGTPEEVAGLAVFLASVHAGYITGATINVDGGKFHSIV